MPAGFSVRLSPRVRVCDRGSTVVDGSAGRVLHLSAPAAGRLSPEGVRADDPLGRRLVDRLLATGVADPCWSGPAPDSLDDAAVADVTVVVPVRDRPDELGRLLVALPPMVPVLVVDDGSAAPEAVAWVAQRHAARVVRHARNLGPAAARNTGLREVRTEFVAFVDSDVVPVPGWLACLRRHFEDPRVALAAPRVLGPAGRAESWLGRYEQARSSLDLGRAPALVRPRTSVAYVPSACLLARRTALGAGFDEAMRSGEDVDLVWRLHRARWRVRYEPAAQVRHAHLARLVPWLRRKAFYGSSAGPLAVRHGDAVAPMVVAPWSVALSAAALAQERWSMPVAAGVLAATTARQRRLLDRAGRPWATAGTLTAEGAVASLRQVGSALTRHYWPVGVAAATVSPSVRRALVVAAVADGVAEWRRTDADLDPVRFTLARRLDDLAYGTGLWVGVLRSGGWRALIPAVAGRREAGVALRQAQGPARQGQGPARQGQGPARPAQGPAGRGQGPARRAQGASPTSGPPTAAQPDPA